MNAIPEPDSDMQIPDSIDRVIQLDDPAPVACPKCAGEMRLGQLDENMVIVCRECQSLLIQSKIFGQIVQQRRKDFSGAEALPDPLDTRELQRSINCPGCQNKMSVHPYHGPGNVVVDSCSRCWFTFLDYGELSSIEKAPGKRE